jgi:hypothetical protein
MFPLTRSAGSPVAAHLQMGHNKLHNFTGQTLPDHADAQGARRMRAIGIGLLLVFQNSNDVTRPPDSNN